MYVAFNFAAGASAQGSTSSSWATVSAGVFAPTGQVNLLGTNGATWNITGIQLETGTVATPFEQRPISVELALCQRYYQHLSSANSSSVYNAYGTGFTAATTYGFYQIPLVNPMRANPSITYNTVSQYRCNFSTCTAIQINTSSPSSLSIRADSTGLTSGQGGQFDSNNNTTSYIGISA
jgi:hypothetical protein